MRRRVIEDPHRSDDELLECSQMLETLYLAVGVLVASLAGILLYAGCSFWREHAKDRAVYREGLKARDSGRTSKPVERIFLDWQGPSVPIEKFRQVWLALASCFDIDPELMRPDDKVDELMVSTASLGPDGLDLAEFFLDFLPHNDPFALLEEVAYGAEESVGDVVTAVVLG